MNSTTNPIKIQILKPSERINQAIPYLSDSGIVKFFAPGSNLDLPGDFKNWYRPEKMRF